MLLLTNIILFNTSLAFSRSLFWTWPSNNSLNFSNKVNERFVSCACKSLFSFIKLTPSRNAVNILPALSLISFRTGRNKFDDDERITSSPGASIVGTLSTVCDPFPKMVPPILLPVVLPNNFIASSAVRLPLCSTVCPFPILRLKRFRGLVTFLDASAAGVWRKLSDKLLLVICLSTPGGAGWFSKFLICLSTVLWSLWFLVNLLEAEVIRSPGFLDPLRINALCLAVCWRLLLADCCNACCVCGTTFGLTKKFFNLPAWVSNAGPQTGAVFTAAKRATIAARSTPGVCVCPCL